LTANILAGAMFTPRVDDEANLIEVKARGGRSPFDTAQEHLRTDPRLDDFSVGAVTVPRIGTA
jgi:hypothetical protein